ncbi:MAG: polysaccharide pyruvyl transferase family protein, partial [Candidatus Baldrarchaeia archaeon]
MKILIINSLSSLNNGAMAIVTSIVKAIRRRIPNSSFILLSGTPMYDKKRYKLDNFEVIGREWFSRKAIIPGFSVIYVIICFFRCLLWNLADTFLKINLNGLSIGSAKGFIESDVYLDLSGDSITDKYGYLSLLYILYEISMGILLGKKVVLCSETIGPFKSRIARFLTKIILNRVSLITVREELSEEYLKNILGVYKPNIHLTADPAFLLKPNLNSKVKNLLREVKESGKDIVIGISPSNLITQMFASKQPILQEEYFLLIANFIENLVNTFNAAVILIPHVYYPDDDRIAAFKIWRKIKSRDLVKLLYKKYTADELKGIISQCNLFISYRMHPAIASLSLCIPTIVVGYS